MTTEDNGAPDIFDGIEGVTDNDNEDVWKPQLRLPEPLSEIILLAVAAHGDESFESEQRPRGILSQADREYLFGMKDYAHTQSEAKRKQDIRKRVKHALKDFGLLWLLWDKDERRKVLDEMGEEAVEDSIASVITFLYFSLEKDTYRFEEQIERGILNGANASQEDRSAGRATNVDVSIDIEYDPDADAIYERLQDGKGDELTVEEIGVLVRAGKLEPEDLAELDGRTSLSLGMNDTDIEELQSKSSSNLDELESDILGSSYTDDK